MVAGRKTQDTQQSASFELLCIASGPLSDLLTSKIGFIPGFGVVFQCRLGPQFSERSVLYAEPGSV